MPPSFKGVCGVCRFDIFSHLNEVGVCSVCEKNDVLRNVLRTVDLMHRLEFQNAFAYYVRDNLHNQCSVWVGAFVTRLINIVTKRDKGKHLFSKIQCKDQARNV